MDLRKIVITDTRVPATNTLVKGGPYETVNRNQCALLFCKFGQMTYIMNNQKFVLDPHHALFLPTGCTYSYYIDKKAVVYALNFSCLNIEDNEIISFNINDLQTFADDCEKIVEQSTFGEYRLATVSMLYKFFDRLLNENIPEKDHLYPAIQYLEKNIFSPDLTNGTLAKKANMSEVHFRKLFAEKYNTTPKQYILDVRMKKAKQMLKASNLAVTEIAFMCGFTSLYSFSRAFKDKTGKTPTEYAKSHENNYY